MPKLPDAVLRFKLAIAKDPATQRDFGGIANKLIRETPELVAMWRAIERRSESRDPWVWIFLSHLLVASRLPPYQYLSAEDRRDLSSNIVRLSNRLVRLIEKNELDLTLIFGTGVNFPGFRFYEDFGEINQAQIDAAEKEKLSVCRLIREVATRATEKIKEPVRGKAGNNVRVIRFVRSLADSNRGYYNAPLLLVVATAANALFGTEYSESDVSNLLTR